MVNSPQILLVEDELSLRKFLAASLASAGYGVDEAATGQQGLRHAAQQPPDLVILDIMMPEISGLDILRQMRRDPALANIPVVVVSATTMPADIKNGMEAGASIYLTKPVGFHELKEAVVRALGSQPTAL